MLGGNEAVQLLGVCADVVKRMDQRRVDDM